MSDARTSVEVFCIYAHQDEPYLQELHTHIIMLKRQGFISTYDNRQIDAGADRMETINAHLESASVILLLVSPNFLASDYCYEIEMKRALQRHEANAARVIPIIVRPCDWDYSPFAGLQCLPHNGKPITLWDNNDQAWNSVTIGVRQLIENLRLGDRTEQPLLSDSLASARSERHDFYEHVRLARDTYIERTEMLAQIRAELLASMPIVALTSALQQIKLNALHGMGGIGKTIMARALCDDPIIQATFPDGVLWVTLGPEPEMIAIMRELVNALGGTVRESAPTVNNLKNILIKLLAERACLLILDDVWRQSHAEAFLVGGPRCRLLLTLRDAEIAEALGARRYPIPVMRPDEAVLLLEKWGGAHLAEVEPELKYQIVERLGYLPLAVKLAGAQLKRKQPDKWLESFHFRILKSSRYEDIHDSLERTFELSLGMLDEEVYDLYIALALFREDEPIPKAGIEKLWMKLAYYGIEEINDLLDDLGARALLETDVHLASQSRTITIHGLLRDLISIRLGEKRHKYHQLLLEAYRATCQDTGWHTASDDGYLYDHLAYHLLACGAGDELVSLFADQEWLRVRVNQRNSIYDAYLEDLLLAWKYVMSEARRQDNADQEDMNTFVQCLRFLLIYTSINSLAENYEPDLMAWAVKDSIWPLHRALSLLRKVPNPLKRAQVCATILGIVKLEEAEYEEVQRLGVETALVLQDGQDKANTFIKLLPFLEGERQTIVLEKCFHILMDKDEEWQEELLPALVPYMTQEQRLHIHKKAIGLLLAPVTEAKLKQAMQLALPVSENAETLLPITTQVVSAIGEWSLKIAFLFPEGLERAEALVDLLPYLPERMHRKAIKECLRIAESLKDEKEQMEMIAKLMPYLQEEELQAQVEQSLRVVQQIPGEGKRAKVLAALASALKGRSIDRALQADLLPVDEREQAEVLVNLVPRMSQEKRNRVLTPLLRATLRISNEKKRANTLAIIAPHLAKKNLIEDTLQAIEKSLYSEENQVKVLIALAPRLTDMLLERGRQMALSISDEVGRITTLGVLAAQYPLDQRVDMQTALLRELPSLSDERKRMDALVALAAYLAGEPLAQYVPIVLKQAEGRTLVDILVAIAPRVTGGLLKQCLDALVLITDEEERGRALSAYALQLTGDEIEVGLWMALACTNEWMRARILIKLAKQLKIENNHTALKRSLQAAMFIWQKKEAVEYNIKLASCMSESQRAIITERGLYTILNLSDQKKQSALLAVLAPLLTGDLVKRALPAILHLPYKEEREKALAALAPQLVGELLTWSIQIALALPDERRQAEVFIAFASRLPEGLLEKRMKVLQTLFDDEQSHVPMELMPYLAKETRIELLEQRLQGTLKLADEQAQARAAVILIADLQGTWRDSILEKSTQIAFSSPGEAERAELLAAINPHLTGEQHNRAIAESTQIALALPDKRRQAELLLMLAPWLAKTVIKQEINAVMALPDVWMRIKVLIALVRKSNRKQRIQLIERYTNKVMLAEERQIELLAAFYLQIVLVPDWSDHLIEQRLRVLLVLVDKTDQSRILESFVGLLPIGLRLEAVLNNLTYEESQARALVELVPQLGREQIDLALRATLKFKNEGNKLRPLIALIPRLAKEQRDQVLEDVLTWQSEKEIVGVLMTLAAWLREMQVQQVIEKVLTFEVETHRAKVFAVMAPNLGLDLQEKVLRNTVNFSDEENKSKVLGEIAPKLDLEFARKNIKREFNI